MSTTDGFSAPGMLTDALNRNLSTCLESVFGFRMVEYDCAHGCLGLWGLAVAPGVGLVELVEDGLALVMDGGPGAVVDAGGGVACQ